MVMVVLLGKMNQGNGIVKLGTLGDSFIEKRQRELRKVEL